MRFAKLQGLGNDFVVVDLREGAEPVPSPQAPHVVQALCDRRHGVGGDGVLLILPPETEGACARVRVLNADGSEAEMCGNGIRCVAAHLYERDEACRRQEIVLDTGAGALTCEIASEDGDRVDTVTVGMGRPRLLRREIPMEGPEDQRAICESLEVGGTAVAITAVSLGNPHAVTFSDSRDAALRREAERLGPALEVHAAFPKRTNVEVVSAVGPRELEAVVWERGVGLTLACGTGACAAAVAACLTSRIEAETEVTVRLPGGTLAITVAADYSDVRMRGPAEHVFDGHIDLAALLGD